MYQKTAVSVMMMSWLVLSIVYYNNVYNVFRSSNLSKYYKYYKLPSLSYNGSEDFLIDTSGCYIPNYSKRIQFHEPKHIKLDCGERAIFIEKTANSSIKFLIDPKKIMKYYKGTEDIECCYRFAIRSTVSGKEDYQIKYSTCVPFQNGSVVELKQEVITVICDIKSLKTSKRKPVYEDAYLVLKKLQRNVTKIKDKPWNVLILGMDTVSRARVFNSMPQTVRYLQQHNWLDFRGYQKVESNTFPNVMAFMTGKNISTVNKLCEKGMHTCNNFILWNKFKSTGYVTAYGEDFLQLPDTFSRFNGFKTPPTDHYTRPFFLTGETMRGNLICSKKKSSAMHLLDYAMQFVNAYKNNNFFGMFWLNSYTHNLQNLPTLIDKEIVEFFKELNNIGVLNNTFIIFLSDHGIRFGDFRMAMESYFEERLPMFFMWAPTKFRNQYAEENYNLQINQNRLVTPYDLYMTLWNILEISSDSVAVTTSEACPQCRSMFEEKSPHRRCIDAGVDESWCTCHNMTYVDQNDTYVTNSLQLAVSYIQKRSQSVPTVPCKACIKLELKSVLRIHSYYDMYNNSTYYVIAIVMSPENIAYEIIVLKNGDEHSVTEPSQQILLTSTISGYNARGDCVKNRYDRAYCVCKKDDKCNKKNNKYIRVHLFHSKIFCS